MQKQKQPCPSFVLSAEISIYEENVHCTEKPICTICDKDHDTQNFPSLPRIKAALQPMDEEDEAIYLMTSEEAMETVRTRYEL